MERFGVLVFECCFGRSLLLQQANPLLLQLERLLLLLQELLLFPALQNELRLHHEDIHSSNIRSQRGSIPCCCLTRDISFAL